MCTYKEFQKDEEYVKCDTELDLIAWIDAGGWTSIEEFEETYQISRDEIIGKYFFIWGGCSIDIKS